MPIRPSGRVVFVHWHSRVFDRRSVYSFGWQLSRRRELERAFPQRNSRTTSVTILPSVCAKISTTCSCAQDSVVLLPTTQKCAAPARGGGGAPTNRDQGTRIRECPSSSGTLRAPTGTAHAIRRPWRMPSMCLLLRTRTRTGPTARTIRRTARMPSMCQLAETPK